MAMPINTLSYQLTKTENENERLKKEYDKQNELLKTTSNKKDEKYRILLKKNRLLQKQNEELLNDKLQQCLRIEYLERKVKGYDDKYRSSSVKFDDNHDDEIIKDEDDEAQEAITSNVVKDDEVQEAITSNVVNEKDLPQPDE